MINVIERFDFRWIAGETLEKIEYELDGQKKTYVADFLLNDTLLIEIKPEKMRDLPINLAKKYAAEIFCEKKGWKYKITEPIKLYSHRELLLMHLDGVITLQAHKLKRYAKLLEEISKAR